MKHHLLILHGALGCKEQFSQWKIALSEKFNCHIFDFAGHGSRSAENNSFSIPLFAVELEEYIKRNNLNQPHVFGYSMGGYVALYTAVHTKSLLGKIITLATKFDWNPESSKRESGYLKPEIMLQKVPALVEQLKTRHGAHWEKVVAKTAEMMLELGHAPLLTPISMAKLKN